PSDVADLERYTANPRRWRDRFVRLAEMLPPGVRVTSVALDPGNVPTTTGVLVIMGQARRTAGGDHLQEVMELISAIRRDSVCAADYPNVRLASTHSRSTSDARTEFVIECH